MRRIIQKEKERDFKGVVRFITIALIVIAMIGFCLKLVSSAWVIPKATTCQMMNVTGTDCDTTWCNVIDCSYNSSLEACVCIKEVNVTNETGEINSEVKSYIHNEITKFNKTLQNTTINKTTNVDSINITEFEGKLLKLRTDLSDDINDLKYNLNQDDSSPLFNNSSLTLVLIFGVIGFVVLFIMKNQPQKSLMKTPIENGDAPSIHKKIQTTSEMNKDERIKEQSEQIKNSLEIVKENKKEKKD